MRLFRKIMDSEFCRNCRNAYQHEPRYIYNPEFYSPISLIMPQDHTPRPEPSVIGGNASSFETRSLGNSGLIIKKIQGMYNAIIDRWLEITGW